LIYITTEWTIIRELLDFSNVFGVVVVVVW